MFLNLFMQHMPSLFTQDLVHIKKGKILCKLACSSWWKDWKRFMKIKFWKSLKTKLWAWIVDLNHSMYICKPKPNHKHKHAAPESQEQICIFHTKFSKLKTHIGDKLPSIMTRIQSIGVKKISTTDYFP